MTLRIFAEPAPADMDKKSFRHDHCSHDHLNCSNTNRFPVVNCSRLTCGNFSMPNMSATGLRGAAATFERLSLQQDILYRENVTVTCGGSNRKVFFFCRVDPGGGGNGIKFTHARRL